jgi:hypothetical protein
MTANIPLRPAAKPEPFARPPRCGGELVAGRLSGWYIRRARPAGDTHLEPEQPAPTRTLLAEGAPR